MAKNAANLFRAVILGAIRVGQTQVLEGESGQEPG